jgi:N-acetylmuramoyl-L-alanine amidase
MKLIATLFRLASVLGALFAAVPAHANNFLEDSRTSSAADFNALVMMNRDTELSEKVRNAIGRAMAATNGNETKVDSVSPATSQLELRDAKVEGNRITIDFSNEIHRFDFGSHEFEDTLSRIYFAAGEAVLGRFSHIEFVTLIEGTPLRHWLAYPDEFAKANVARGKPQGAFIPKAGSSAISGRRVAISPGHGYYFDAGVWKLQRDLYSGIVEDFVNSDIVIYLNQFLQNGGAMVRPTRNLNKTAGNGISQNPKWQESAREHIRALGVPADVWDSSTVDINDDIRARPLYANWLDAGAANADALVSIHNNGGGGTGTETLYDTTNGQQVESRKLADAVHKKLVDTIRAKYDAAWVDRGVKGFDGSYGENRLATRPAVIVEIAFMDRPTPDNAALRDEKFKSLAAEAISQGITDYFASLADNVAPSAPVNVSARNASGQVNVMWDAASDNVGVAGYRIFRDGAQVGVSTGLNFNDANIVGGTSYRYTVVAHDAAGNPSNPSAAVTITAEAGVEPRYPDYFRIIDPSFVSCAVNPDNKRCK